MNRHSYPIAPKSQKKRDVGRSTAKILLWLFVINLGIALGAGLYEARIEVPQWLITQPASGYQWDAEAARQANTGLRFWVYVTTIPLTLLTLANAIAAWKQRSQLRHWWLGAVGAATLDRLLTFSYFVPTMIALMNGSLPESEAVSTALRWANLNHFRHILILVAWLSALKTFALMYERISCQTRSVQ